MLSLRRATFLMGLWERPVLPFHLYLLLVPFAKHWLTIRCSLELFRLVNLPASHIFSPSVSQGFAFIGTVLYACRHLSAVHLPLLFMIFCGRWYKLQKCLISGMHFILMEDYMTGPHFITSHPTHSSITSPIHWACSGISAIRQPVSDSSHAGSPHLQVEKKMHCFFQGAEDYHKGSS